MPGTLFAQQLPAQIPGQSAGPTASNFQGSVTAGHATGQTLELSLDDAMQRGLKNNLGMILERYADGMRRERRDLTELQALLPDVEFNAHEAVQQVDLAAEGLRIPGFPTIIGPFGYTDLRGYADLVAGGHEVAADVYGGKAPIQRSELSEQDARDHGGADGGQRVHAGAGRSGACRSFVAQVATSKISLDQANANHDAGTSPRLDVLRAQVDYQSLQQQLIVAQNALDKDKLALARVIGLSLEQKFNLSDKAPYAVFDNLDVDAMIKQAHANRKDLAAMVEQTKAAEEQRKGGDGRSVSDGGVQRGLRCYRSQPWNLARYGQCAGHIERAAVQGVRAAWRGRGCAVAIGYAEGAAE